MNVLSKDFTNKHSDNWPFHKMRRCQHANLQECHVCSMLVFCQLKCIVAINQCKTADVAGIRHVVLPDYQLLSFTDSFSSLLSTDIELFRQTQYSLCLLHLRHSSGNKTSATLTVLYSVASQRRCRWCSYSLDRALALQPADWTVS